MNIVMLCTKYSADPINSPYLSDELAGELARQGHEVTVLVADWNGEHAPDTPRPAEPGKPHVLVSGAIVLNWLPLTLRRIVKWLVSPVRLAWTARQLSRKLRPDVVIAYSPLMAMHLPIWALTPHSVPRRFLVQWDFFPDAQAQLGVLRGAFKIRCLRAAETWLMRRFNVIGCMSPRNIEYLREHYSIAPGTEVVHLPLWSSQPSFKVPQRQEVRQRLGIPADVRVFVFGGQLVAGRGIEDMLSASRLLVPGQDRILFLFMGKGPLADAIESEQAAGNSFVRLLPGVPRNEYLGLLTAFDVGIVCTVRDVTVPTFPSKTLDYLLAGLPILASIEAATDYGEFIVTRQLGLSVLAGNIAAFVDATRKMAAFSSPGRPQTLASNSQCISENFSLVKAAEIILRPSFGATQSEIQAPKKTMPIPNRTP